MESPRWFGPSCGLARESWSYAGAGETSPAAARARQATLVACQSFWCEGWRRFKELASPQQLAAPLAIFFVTFRKTHLWLKLKKATLLRLLPAAFAGGRWLWSSRRLSTKTKNNFKRWITRLVRR